MATALSGAAKAAARRDRAIAWLGIAAIVLLSWAYLAHLTGTAPISMADMGMAMGGARGPAALDWLAAFLMWAVMMVAMMVPTAARAVSTFIALTTRRSPDRGVVAGAWLFVGGYVLAWAGYAAIAAAAQVALAQASLLSPMAESTSVPLSALVLLTAGIFQLSRIKDRCLAKCRSPLTFLLAEWRDGGTGAVALGLRHGSYCVLCCWALMALMLVVGAMSLLWMAVLTAFVLGEKLAPAGWHLSRISGALLIAGGAWLAIGSW